MLLLLYLYFLDNPRKTGVHLQTNESLNNMIHTQDSTSSSDTQITSIISFYTCSTKNS
jgi:hypothetical protein